jgi:hypothetical protein
MTGARPHRSSDMKAYHFLFLMAGLAVPMPFFLEAIGRGDYADNEGMSVDDWKRSWARLTRKSD